MELILDYIFTVQFAIFAAIVIFAKLGLKFVPQNRAYVIERFGKYNRTIEAGINFIIPIMDKVAHDRSLKEQAVDVPSQSAITKDNISLTVDGVLYFRVLDPYKASYGVEDYAFAVTQLAQTTMRSEIGKMELDKTFEERDQLNANIVNAINQAAEPWGVQVLRYEIKDIVPPQSVMSAMEAQMRAEREKRAKILESEGDRQAEINRAEGEKQSKVLSAEGDKAEQILRAEGEAGAILRVAEAQADALRKIGEVANTPVGQSAVQLDLATKAIEARHAIARDSSIVLLPDNATDAASVVTQAMSVINTINKNQTPAA
ncbi:SPFH domain-containing protein [Saccharophagus degradans]|uniref:SPFH domain, Band 7 family protein n=1 Tax=Saccharophagus degradans (strain 2-40 / ATCC 43961 / DSM 17024) TaxID=203122 RepID=Q21EU1_SACD2|nr:slipin family protein [Saccharophagus degradans]ABD82788.1 SPFH domain, Band 7 family protein [Saccharophagus degradans 2-40]MBU2986175.1 paraslipin [Saccharophagus degradans]WGO99022.1 paraslipin [Saccharophagus degradans]